MTNHSAQRVEPHIPAGQEQPPPRSAGRRLIISLVIVFVVAIIATGGIIIYRRSNPSNPLPAAITSQVTFPLYYPAKLPPGFVFDQGSASATPQVVTFSVSHHDGKKLIVSQQPVPPDFDFENFYLNSLFGAKEVITPLGKAVIGQIKDATFASIVTDRTWVIINAPAGLPADQMEQLIKSFAPASP